mgnify:CR=1 FL=1
MSIFALFFIISAFITGKYLLNRIKRINGCFIGAFFVILNLFGLGMLDYFENKTVIIGLSFFFQILGGIGNGINTPSTMAVLSSYKDDRETYIGYFEVCAGLGTLFGPLLGSMFYYFGGYKAPFVCIGLFYALMVGLFWNYSKSIEINEDKVEST